MKTNNIINNLKKHLKVYTDDALAKALGVTQPAITQWKTRGVPKRILVKYAVILSNEDTYTDERPREMNLIPVVGIADAGRGIDSLDNGFAPGYTDEWLSRPQGLKDPNAYAVVIRSGAISMLPLLKPGMKVVASPNLQCRSGDLAIIKLKNDQATIKEIKFETDHVVLTAWNRDYEPHELIVDKKDLQFCHPIVWFRTTH